MRPADPLFDEFKGVESQVDGSIAIQHGQLSNRGNDTGSKDQNGLDSSDREAVSDRQPDNQLEAQCLKRSDSDTSSLDVDFGDVIERL